MLNPAFWWLLCLLVGSLGREISCILETTAKKLVHCWSPNLEVGGPVSLCPYGCCAHVILRVAFKAWPLSETWLIVVSSGVFHVAGSCRTRCKHCVAVNVCICRLVRERCAIEAIGLFSLFCCRKHKLVYTNRTNLVRRTRHREYLGLTLYTSSHCPRRRGLQGRASLYAVGWAKCRPLGAFVWGR